MARLESLVMDMGAGGPRLCRAQRWLRFIVGGSLNTALAYFVYLLLHLFIGYQWAYFVAYAAGILFSYWFNAKLVFRAPLSLKGLLAYPLVYIIQYSLSAIALDALVERLDVSKGVAPLVISVIMLPVTYAMSKLVIRWTRSSEVA